MPSRHVSPPSAPSKGLSRKGAARREAILRTAFDVIARGGYREATMGAIARELQMDTPHLLYYFNTREDLLREVLERWAIETQSELADDIDFLEYYRRAVHRDLNIRGVVHLYLSFAAEAVDPEHPAHAFFRSRFDTVATYLQDVLVAGQEAGLIRPEIDPAVQARILIAIADGLQLQSLLDPSVDAPADLDIAISSLFVSGRKEPIPATWSRWDPQQGGKDDAPGAVQFPF